MSAIAKQLSGFIFNGAALALASAPWKGQVRAIYGFNASGNGYQVFKPASGFNSLTQLSQDGVYIVDAATPGFELPGAVLTGTGSTTASPVELRALFCTVNEISNKLIFHITAVGADSVVIFSNGTAEFQVTHALVAGQETVVDTESQDLDLSNLDARIVQLAFYNGGNLVLKYAYSLDALPAST